MEAARAVTPISTATVAMKAIDTTFTLGLDEELHNGAWKMDSPEATLGGQVAKPKSLGMLIPWGGYWDRRVAEDGKQLKDTFFYFSQ